MQCPPKLRNLRIDNFSILGLFSFNYVLQITCTWNIYFEIPLHSSKTLKFRWIKFKIMNIKIVYFAIGLRYNV